MTYKRPPLYKIPAKGKVCGVCAGLAENLGYEVWIIRLAAVTMLLFFPEFILIAYFMACMVLDKKPRSKLFKGKEQPAQRRTYQAAQEDSSPETQPSAHQDARSLNNTFKSLEIRLRKLETYVTSNEYHLNKEFSKMEDQ